MMKIRCVVTFPTLFGFKPIADYIFNYDDDSERRVFAEQARCALAAGQMITTFTPFDEPKLVVLKE